jgi:hypothetical protein
MQYPRTARLASIVLGVVYLLFSLACTPGIIATPTVYARYGRFFEQFSLLCSAIALYAAIVITLDDRDKFVVHAPLHSKVASLSLVTALSKGTSLHLVRNMIAGPHGQGQDGEGGILLRRIHE